MPKGAAPGAAAPQATPPGGASPGFQSQPLASTPGAGLGASPGAAGGSGLFDELTDTDLAPIKAVQVPGAKAAVKPPSANANKLLQEAVSGSDRRGEGMLMKGEAPRPPFLIFLGVINWMAALFYFGLMFLFIGLVDMGLEAMENEVPELTGLVFYLLAGMMGVMAFLSAATGVACFMRGKFFWYVVLVSYGWALAFNIFDVVMKATGEDAGMNIIKGIGGIMVGAAIWFWLHGESVRDYYQIKEEPLWRTIVVDLSGFLVAGSLGAAILLLQ